MMQVVEFRERQINEWDSQRRYFRIYLKPMGPNADARKPAIAGMRENAGFPFRAIIYATTRTLLDGITSTPTEYLELLFFFDQPVPENDNAVIVANVLQEGADSFRIRGPFGLLSPQEEEALRQETRMILGSRGIASHWHTSTKGPVKIFVSVCRERYLLEGSRPSNMIAK